MLYKSIKLSLLYIYFYGKGISNLLIIFFINLLGIST